MTKFHFAGRYDGDPQKLITHPHEPGHVAFKEFSSMKTLGIVTSVISIVIAVITFTIYFLVSGSSWSTLGFVLMLVSLVPHEFLHAICFESDVYMYENLKQGMLFVVGPGTFSKGGFIFMSMLPNLVFGFLPFLLFLINPSWKVLGTFGALSIAAGAGDYYNVFNAITQMPKGSRTYLHGTNSFWYMPQETKQ